MDEVPTNRSMRAQRTQRVLTKALTVAVGSAMAIDLRKFFEQACKDDPEMMQELFQAKFQSPSELSSQSLYHLRQKLEIQFDYLLDKHNVRQSLLELERCIREAELTKIRQIAHRNNMEQYTQEDEDVDMGDEDSLIRSSRLQVLDEERLQLQEQVELLQKRNAELQSNVESKRKAALEEISRLEKVATDLSEAEDHLINACALSS